MAFKPVSNKVVIESAIDSLNRTYDEDIARAKKQYIEESVMFREGEERINLMNRRNTSFSRYNSFSESLTSALLGEAVYYVFSKAMDKSIMEQSNVTGMMRAMVSDFIKEDYNSILSKMRTKSATLSEMYNLITSTRKKILESVDKNDPTTFCIDSETKDEFFDKLDSMDTESITNAIRDRVSNAVDDFMVSNRQDHERIMTALQMTKDKLEEKKDAPEEVKESYQQLSKRVIGKIRNRKKGVFESMVTAMSESVLKNDELKEEFMEGAKLNVPKIVDRIQTMYTFIETVNTMQLYKIEKEYMESLIESLRL